MQIKISFLFLLSILFVPLFSFAQIGGNETYEFLNLTASPRVAAMGGDFLAVNDNDINLALSNPSLINKEMDNHLGANFVDYYSTAKYGFASYANSFEKAGSFVASMGFIDYGTFDGRDETGAYTGDFYAGESMLNIGWGRQLDSLFSIGANVKMIYSSKESYSSYGLAVDVAGSYTSRDRSFVSSLVAKNIGRQLKAFSTGNLEPLPFELQIGLSKRLQHLPFRYSVIYNHIEKWDLRYDDPSTRQIDPITGEAIKDNSLGVIADNLMRHIVFGGELILSKNLSLRAGYNYKRRQELKIEDKTSTVGFSWGIGFRISKFHFSYARSAYHLSGSPNYIAITTHLSDFFKKKN